MADGVNKASIRVLGQVASVLPRREAPAGGSHAATNVATDAYVRKDGTADTQALATIVADLEARIAALEDKLSDLYDEETYAPVPLGQLSKTGAANVAANNAASNNAPAMNNGAAVNNAPVTNNAPANNAAANNAPVTNNGGAIANRPLTANNAPATNNAAANNAAANNAPIALGKLPLPSDDDAPVANAAPAADAAPAEAAAPAGRSYTVKKGDTLWAIAERELGDATRFPEIARANAEAYPSLAGNPNYIKPGWTLDLPVGPAVAAPAPAATKPAPAKEKPAAGKPTAAKPPVAQPAPSDDDVIVAKPAKPSKPAKPGKKAEKPQAEVVVPEVLPAEKAIAKPAKPAGKGTDVAPVPIDMSDVKIAPGKDWTITNQDTKVTGVGTSTETRWEVGADGKAKPTKQDTQITDADTNTKTRWEAPQPGAKPKPGPKAGEAPVPIDMGGIKIDPLKDFEIESQETSVEAVETNTDTHWEVEQGKAVATDQKTQVTAAETLTRTRWKAKGSVVPQPADKPLPAEPKPLPAAKQLSDAEAVAWLRKNLGADGRISRKELEAMPAGPGKDALLAHFDALLFGFIDPGKDGWVDLHEGDLARLERALADGGSITGLAGQLTKWVHAERRIGDLSGDGKQNEADVALYAGRLRGGQAVDAPTPASPPAANGSDERLQADLEAFLKNHKGSGDVVHLMNTNPRYLAAATMPQKARLVVQALAGMTNNEERKAALTVLEAGAAKGELLGVLNQLHERKKLDDLFSNMAGHGAGARMAELFAKEGLYKNSGVVREMNSAAVADYVKALGWKHPMIGTNDDLRALPEGNKRFMMKQLLEGEFTQTEHRQATWINQHLDAPIDLPKYDPFAHQHGR